MKSYILAAAFLLQFHFTAQAAISPYTNYLLEDFSRRLACNQEPAIPLVAELVASSIKDGVNGDDFQVLAESSLLFARRELKLVNFCPLYQ